VIRIIVDLGKLTRTFTFLCLINNLIKVGARVSYHAPQWYVHVTSALPLVHHYRAVLAEGP
jgi:hypothetical protein